MIIFRKKNAMQSKFSHKNVKTMLCKHVCLPDHRKNKHARFMNQELLNSEPNMIIFRKKVQCKANLVIEMSRQCYVNMCVLQMTGKINV